MAEERRSSGCIGGLISRIIMLFVSLGVSLAVVAMMGSSSDVEKLFNELTGKPKQRPRRSRRSRRKPLPKVEAPPPPKRPKIPLAPKQPSPVAKPSSAEGQPMPAPPPPPPVADLEVYGRSGAPIGEVYKLRISIKNKGGAEAKAVRVKVRLLSSVGELIAELSAQGPTGLKAGKRGKYSAVYRGEFAALISKIEPVLSFEK